jgi:hypothetical protein
LEEPTVHIRTGTNCDIKGDWKGVFLLEFIWEIPVIQVAICLKNLHFLFNYEKLEYSASYQLNISLGARIASATIVLIIQTN